MIDEVYMLHSHLPDGSSAHNSFFLLFITVKFFLSYFYKNLLQAGVIHFVEMLVLLRSIPKLLVFKLVKIISGTAHFRNCIIIKVIFGMDPKTKFIPRKPSTPVYSEINTRADFAHFGIFWRRCSVFTK